MGEDDQNITKEKRNQENCRTFVKELKHVKNLKFGNLKKNKTELNV